MRQAELECSSSQASLLAFELARRPRSSTAYRRRFETPKLVCVWRGPGRSSDFEHNVVRLWLHQIRKLSLYSTYITSYMYNGSLRL